MLPNALVLLCRPASSWELACSASSPTLCTVCALHLGTDDLVFHHGFNFLDHWWDEMDFCMFISNLCVFFFKEMTKMTVVLYLSRLFTFSFLICKNSVWKIYCSLGRFHIFSPSLAVFLFSWWVHALNFSTVKVSNLCVCVCEWALFFTLGFKINTVPILES